MTYSIIVFFRHYKQPSHTKHCAETFKSWHFNTQKVSTQFSPKLRGSSQTKKGHEMGQTSSFSWSSVITNCWKRPKNWPPQRRWVLFHRLRTASCFKDVQWLLGQLGYKLIVSLLAKCKWFSPSFSIGRVYPGCEPLRPVFDPFKCWQPLSSKAAITGGNNSTAQRRPTVLQKLCIPQMTAKQLLWSKLQPLDPPWTTLVQTVTLALPRAQSIFPKSERKFLALVKSIL